ncbi:hypothetical protein ACQ7HM_13930 [Williamsia sp. MIQD14]|uniref:hypothetical protein n=1 Tax=Williamsia sp. MIQD14 TaxID=3425703 RepID=UPI003DA06BC1
MTVARSESVIWATRGRTWGFRFILDAGHSDPLQEYERAFGDEWDAPTAWHRHDGRVALRFPDPLGRHDSAGRVIPHEFVLFGDLADAVDSVEDGVNTVWPLVSEMYAHMWEAPNPPNG